MRNQIIRLRILPFMRRWGTQLSFLLVVGGLTVFGIATVLIAADVRAKSTASFQFVGKIGDVTIFTYVPEGRGVFHPCLIVIANNPHDNNVAVTCS